MGFRYQVSEPYRYTMFDAAFIKKISKRINERSLIEAKMKLWATKAWEETIHIFGEWSTGSFNIERDNGKSFTVINNHCTALDDPDDNFIVKILMSKDWTGIRIITKYGNDLYEEKDQEAYKARIAHIMLLADENLIKQHEVYQKEKYYECDYKKRKLHNQIKSIINQIEWKRHTLKIWNKVRWTISKWYFKLIWRKR